MENNENEIYLDDDDVIEVNQEDNSTTDTVKTYTEEEVEEIKSNLKKEFDEKSQDIFDKRWAREKSNIEKENAELFQIEDVLKEQLGAKNRKELIEKIGDFYQVDMSPKAPQLTEKQEKVLAKAEADDIKSLGISEMIAEANRITSIPKEKRTIRDEIIFQNLAEEITEQKNKENLKQKGYDLAILEDSGFKNFRKKFSYNTDVAETIDLYKLLQEKKSVTATKPASAGSAKSNVNQNSVKDSYTYEESLQFTKKDFDNNPALWEAVQKSMKNW